MTLFDNLCSYNNLLLAYQKARKNKTRLWYVRKFCKNLDRNLIKLESELRSGGYTPHQLKSFVIRDPKTRVISSSHFRDRVVHHAICNIIEPIFERTYIHDSYASRKGKGTHAAIKRFDSFMMKVSKNGRLTKNAKDCNMIIGYVLKADIKHYFETVNHKTLLYIIEKRIHDGKILQLIGKILDNHGANSEGMPIGNLTSQVFANVYLNELDYFVKHTLHAKFYIRYLDDFVIFHNSKNVLENWRREINKFLSSELELELHPEKSKIYPLSNGVNFLGFRIFCKYKLLKKSNVRLIEKRIEEFAKLYQNAALSESAILASMEDWNAYAMHANAYKFRKRIAKLLKRKLSKPVSVS